MWFTTTYSSALRRSDVLFLCALSHSLILSPCLSLSHSRSHGNIHTHTHTHKMWEIWDTHGTKTFSNLTYDPCNSSYTWPAYCWYLMALSCYSNFVLGQIYIIIYKAWWFSVISHFLLQNLYIYAYISLIFALCMYVYINIIVKNIVFYVNETSNKQTRTNQTKPTFPTHPGYKW